MFVVIVGLGEVGTHIAQLLSNYKGYEVIGIDIDSNKLEKFRETCDIKTINGYGASLPVLKDAEVSNAQFVISVSSSEEVNIISALVSKQLGAKNTIARVSSPFYLENENVKEYEALGIDILLSPERRTALKIFQSIENPFFIKVDSLGGGRVFINQLMVDEKSGFADKTIEDLKLNTNILIVGIDRDNDFLFPSGSFLVKNGDTLFMAARRQVMERIDLFLPMKSHSVDRIILLGASKINYFLAKIAQDQYRVLLIEPDSEKSGKIAPLLDKTAFYNDDLFSSELLDELLLSENDFFVVATESDETNLLLSVLLNDRGLSKIACVTHKSKLSTTIKKAGIHQIFSPQSIIASDIASILRTQELISLESFKNAKAEFVELIVHPDSVVVGKTIDNSPIPEKTIFVAIIRSKEVLIPRGDTLLEKNDTVIVLCLEQELEKIEELLRS